MTFTWWSFFKALSKLKEIKIRWSWVIWLSYPIESRFLRSESMYSMNKNILWVCYLIVPWVVISKTDYARYFESYSSGAIELPFKLYMIEISLRTLIQLYSESAKSWMSLTATCLPLSLCYANFTWPKEPYPRSLITVKSPLI